MAAANATTVFATSPLLGVDVGAKSSTAAFKLLTVAQCSNGYRHFYGRASEALGSIETVLLRSLGSMSSDSGSGGFTMNAPGGLTSGQYGWCRKTAL